MQARSRERQASGEGHPPAHESAAGWFPFAAPHDGAEDGPADGGEGRRRMGGSAGGKLQVNNYEAETIFPSHITLKQVQAARF